MLDHERVELESQASWGCGRKRALLCALAAGLGLLTACSNSKGSGGSGGRAPDLGGVVGSGGGAVLGGAVAGGSVASGGAQVGGIGGGAGGTIGAGGTSELDAALGTGGASASGGVLGSGGGSSTSDASSVGGTLASGGLTGAGGIFGSGAVAGTGGTMGSGGLAGTGGALGSGGATVTGGSSGTSASEYRACFLPTGASQIVVARIDAASGTCAQIALLQGSAGCTLGISGGGWCLAGASVTANVASCETFQVPTGAVAATAASGSMSVSKQGSTQSVTMDLTLQFPASADLPTNVRVQVADCQASCAAHDCRP